MGPESRMQPYMMTPCRGFHQACSAPVWATRPLGGAGERAAPPRLLAAGLRSHLPAALDGSGCQVVTEHPTAHAAASVNHQHAPLPWLPQDLHPGVSDRGYRVGTSTRRSDLTSAIVTLLSKQRMVTALPLQQGLAPKLLRGAWAEVAHGSDSRSRE